MLILIIICPVLAVLNITLILLYRETFEELYKRVDGFYNERRKFNLVTFGCASTKSGIEKYLKDGKYSKIAIYGVGMLFSAFKDEICSIKDIKIQYYIDQNDKRKFIGGVPIIHLEQIRDQPDVDLIVVTVIGGYDIIAARLKQKTNARIVSIEEMIYWY